MTVKLWYPKKGEFVKEVEVSQDQIPEQRFTLLRYESVSKCKETGMSQGRRAVNWVFVNIGGCDYEYDYKEYL